jgi:hypothetical protein
MEKTPGTHLTGALMVSSPGVNALKKNFNFLALPEIEARLSGRRPVR